MSPSPALIPHATIAQDFDLMGSNAQDRCGDSNGTWIAMDDEIPETFRLMMADHFALKVAVMSLLRVHPDPAVLRAAMERQAEAIQAILLGMTWTDQNIAKFENSMAQLLKGLERQS